MVPILSSSRTHATVNRLVAVAAAAALVGCSSDHAGENHGGHDGGGTFTSLPNPAIIVATGGDGTVTVIDPESLTVVSSVPVASGLHPHHISASLDRARVLVTATSTDLSAGHTGGHTGGHGASAHTAIYLLDVSTRELRGVIEVDATAHNAAFTGDGNSIVLGMLEHGMVAGYDATSFAQVFSSSGFDSPLEVTPTNVGLLLVAESSTGKVAAFDPSSRTVSERFDVGPLPVAAWSSGGADYYVSVEEGRQLRHIVEGDTSVTLDSHAIDLEGAPGQALLTPDGSELWVAVEDRAVIAVYNAADHTKITELAAGTKPHGIAFDPGGERAFVTDEGGARVLVIDVAARSVTHEIPTGAKPNGILWLAR